MATLAQQIEKADADIAKYSNQISVRRRLENQWRNSTTNCSTQPFLKQKSCKEDNQMRIDKANAYAKALKNSEELLAEAKSIRRQLLDLQEEGKKSEFQANLTLANLGTTVQAVQTQAELEGEAAILRAELEGEATLKSSTEASKSQKYVFIAVAVAIVLIGGIYAWTKFKK